MKRSISFTGQRVLLTAGGLGDWIGLKAQWPDHFAPESIHCLMSSICLAVSLWLDRGGGIRSSVSLVVMRRYISLSAVRLWLDRGGGIRSSVSLVVMRR